MISSKKHCFSSAPECVEGDILEFLGYPLPNFWPRRLEGMAI